MTIDWTVIGTHIVDAVAWLLTHPAETAATVTLVASWFGLSNRLKEDAALARSKLRLDRLKMVGELAYGQAAFNDRKSGVKTNKLAAAIEAADQFLNLLDGTPASEDERKLLTGLFTARHEGETAIVTAAAPTQPNVESLGC